MGMNEYGCLSFPRVLENKRQEGENEGEQKNASVRL